ncbi:MAG: hypothetical protein ACRDH2_19595 [Anaerolineales bacterium]
METYLTWAAGLLLLGCVLAGFGGVRALAGARRLPYFQLRRQTLLRGWRLVLISVGLLIASGLVLAFGRPAAKLLLPPTTTSLPSATPNATSVPPQFSPTPSLTLPPSRTSPPTITLTPSDTPTPTISPTPALPRELVTPILTATVTPPANAIAVDMRFSVRDNCNTPTSTDFFDQIPRRIYAHFFYDNWLPGVQWSGVWLRDGQVIFAETQLWDGSTGGCGFTDFDHNKLWWQVGAYEVQIFIGETWLLSDRFEVVRSTPTATVTLTRTPRTPTLTYTPTSTRTPRTPTLTYTPTPTRTPRPTITP